MSKEEYLKGERKEKALDIIRHCIANRLTNEETLELLKSKEYLIAERTLRRYKSQIYDKSGDSVLDVYQENVGAFLLDDILMFNEMERDGLISTKEGFSIEYKDRSLYINGNKQTEQVTDKYRKYIKREHFRIDIDRVQGFKGSRV